MTAQLTPRNVLVAALLAFLALVPVYCAITGNYFLMSLFTRIVILAMAAVSLNLIMGYGGMVSFGHAAYLGIGGYAVGILAKEGINSGFVQWPVALIASGLFALGVGALSLRTRGVYFIMITLAFAQMVYYVAIGLDRYGGDDGLTIYKRSEFFDPLNLSNKAIFYYLCFALLLACLYIVWRLVHSRFGMVIQGARVNERRMRAIGFPVFRYKLTCFVISGVMCGLAGALLANHTELHQSVDHVLDPLRRPHRDGGAGRDGDGVRPGDGGGRVPAAGGGAVELHRIPGDHPRPDAARCRALCARRHRRHPDGAAPWLTHSSASMA